ncbi:flagellar assembly protein FliH [Methylophaga sp. OBS4]|uniref:flagellar assembly protein FliH n=1 Tax=Methylophaga sp. OBS4 TaxID=2991935 RepID=UPI0022579D84|nr:flagellar assembly protein FliH [Methylophaga sp. OBS4]MCX4187381.1 flagellar assembly protein FliH [Methylophaga sp. OBS4]
MTLSDDALVTQQADVLSAEELADAYERWEAPQMVSVTDVDGETGMLTIEAIEALQQQAQEEGYKAGFEEGRKAGFKAGQDAGAKDIQQQLTHLRQILNTLQQPLAELDQDIERDLVNLSITMARQLIRRELKQEPEHVIGAMRAALQVLPITDRKLKIFVHPQDLPIIQKGLSMEQDDNNWQWIEDPLLTRGGVRLETADTLVDATVEARLNSLISKLLGEERSDGGYDD